MGAIAYSSPAPHARSIELAGDLALRLGNDAIAALARTKIAPMPLKGLLMLSRWPELRGRRDVADIDLLVPLKRMGDAERALATLGFDVTSRTSRGATFASDSWPLSIDLHHRLFAPHLFGVATASLFGRATLDTNLFDAPVTRMSDADQLAHAIGHLAKSRRALGTDDFADIRWLLAHVDAPARTIADHLRTLRLARAAGFVLSAETLRADASAAAVLAALGLQGLEYRLIAFARARPTRYVTPHLLNGSLSDGVRSFRAQALESVRWRTRRWTHDLGRA